MSHLASTAASSSWRDYCAVEEKLALSETKVRELEIELRESKMQHEQEQAGLYPKYTYNVPTRFGQEG